MDIHCTIHYILQSFLYALQEFSKHVQVILGAVVPLVNGDGDTSKQALSLVEFLVIDSATQLNEGLQYINPIPDKPELHRVKRAHDRIMKNRDEHDNLLAVSILTLRMPSVGHPKLLVF